MTSHRMSGEKGSTSRRLAGWYDWLASTALVVLWLLPILWTGTTNRNVPVATNWMQQQHRVACLFLESLESWGAYFVQVQYEGANAWVELDLHGIFDMTVFGFRSRLHAILDETYMQPKGQLRMEAIAEFIRRRYDEQHPLGPKLVAVRFVNVARTVRELGRETGEFWRGALADWVFRDWLIFGEKRWDARKPAHPLWGAKEKPARKGKYVKPAPEAPRPLVVQTDPRAATEARGPKAAKGPSAPKKKVPREITVRELEGNE